MKLCRFGTRLLLVVLAALSLGSSFAVRTLAADQVEIEFEATDTTNLPSVEMRITVLDADGVPIDGLDASAFTLLEDNQEVPLTSVEPYVNPDVRIAVALAFDISGSMYNAIDQAKAAATSFVNSLGPNDLVAVIAFRGEGEVDLSFPFPQINPEREIDFTNDKAQVLSLLDSLSVPSPQAGRTPLYDALFKAGKMASQVTGVDYRLVIAFTDGNEKCRNCGGSSMKADDPIDEAMQERIPVFTIGLGNDADIDYMQRVALKTGGVYYFAPTADMLTNIYQTVVDQVKQQYRLSYDAQIPVDGKEHELELTAITPKGQGTNEIKILYSCSRKPVVTLNYLEAGQALPLQEGQEVTGQVTIAPDIQQNCSSITEVQLLIDGNSVGTADREPFQLVFDFSSLQTAPGLHQVTVRAEDLVGNISDDTTVNVNVPAPPPVVTATAVVGPTPGATPAPTLAPEGCQVNIGSTAIPCWVLALLGTVILLGLVGLVLFLTQRGTDRVCPVCGNVMDPNWSECLFCAERQTLADGPTPAAGMPTIGSPMDVEGTVPEMPAAPAAPPAAYPGALPPVRGEPGPRRAPDTELMRRTPERLAWLIVERGERVGKEYRLQEGDTDIGRGGSNQIILSDASVGRSQAKIRLGKEGFVIHDLAATNPTLVNGQPITRHRLREGDRVQLGNTVLVFKEVQSR